MSNDAGFHPTEDPTAHQKELNGNGGMGPPETHSHDPAPDDAQMGGVGVQAADDGPRDGEPDIPPPGSVVEDRAGEGGGGGGPYPVRPIFLGNLDYGCTVTDVDAIFSPAAAPGCPTVERIDLKRGFAFVFFNDAAGDSERDAVEALVSDINGRHFDRVSKQLRAEFARGDGRVKKKEDIRRANIRPSETLFVVNFNERTTKREDLEILFSQYGTIVRIDMKRNYAFVQFSSTDQAMKAKEATDGGKLDEAIITVEYVARKIPRRDGPPRRDYGGRDDYRNGDYGGRDSYRSSRDGDRGRDQRGGRDRYGDYPGRSGSRGGYRSRSNSPGGMRGRGGRSRSRSPRRGGGADRRMGGEADRYDEMRGRGGGADYDRGATDYRGGRTAGGGGRARSRSFGRSNSRSPPRRNREWEYDRDRHDDRGYRGAQEK